MGENEENLTENGYSATSVLRQGGKAVLRLHWR